MPTSHRDLETSGTMRVRIAIRPGDWGLDAVYEHLADLPDEKSRAVLLRKILMRNQGVSRSTPSAAARPAISVRVSISERDAALDELRQTLRSLPSGQRGGYLKSVLQTIQLGGPWAPTAIAALQPSTVVPARATPRQRQVDPASQEPPDRTRQEMTPIAPARIPPADVCLDKANCTAKSIHFKSRMREAARMTLPPKN